MTALSSQPTAVATSAAAVVAAAIGHRSFSPGEYRAESLVGDYMGLPADIKHHDQIIKIMRSCGRDLPCSQKAVDILEALMSFTRSGDWCPGRRPLVCVSNATLADLRGPSPASIKRYIRELRDAGLISCRDNSDRAIPGITARARVTDLSLCVTKLPYLRELAAARQTKRKYLKESRNRLQSIKAYLKITAAFVAERSPDHLPWIEAVQQELKALRPAETPDGHKLLDRALAKLQALAGGLTANVAEGIEDLQAAVDVLLDLSGRGLKLTPEYTDTKIEDGYTPSSPVRDTEDPPMDHVKGLQEGVVPPAVGHFKTPEPEFPTYLRLLNDADKTLDTVSVAVNQRHLRDCRESQLPDLADYIRHEIGLSESAWGAGIQRHGIIKSLAALVIARATPFDRIIKSRAALAHGILRRSKAEINVYSSLHALRKRREVDDGRPPTSTVTGTADEAVPFAEDEDTIVRCWIRKQGSGRLQALYRQYGYPPGRLPYPRESIVWQRAAWAEHGRLR